MTFLLEVYYMYTIKTPTNTEIYTIPYLLEVLNSYSFTPLKHQQFYSNFMHWPSSCHAFFFPFCNTDYQGGGAVNVTMETITNIDLLTLIPPWVWFNPLYFLYFIEHFYMFRSDTYDDGYAQSYIL